MLIGIVLDTSILDRPKNKFPSWMFKESFQKWIYDRVFFYIFTKSSIAYSQTTFLGYFSIKKSCFSVCFT